MKLGTIHKVAMENLIAQMDQKGSKAAAPLKLVKVEPGQIAVVAISPGAGLSKIFASLGVAAIVEGGQTMNPSTEEILKAFEDLPTDKIIILPNNKNIILAAQAAAANSVKKVVVIPSKNIPQGLSALLHLIPDGDIDEVTEDMNSALTDIETGEITTATRTATIDGVKVVKDEIIALHNGSIVCSSSSLESSVMKFLESADTADKERITLYSGADVTSEMIKVLTDRIQEEYPEQEIEYHEGGQAHYFYIMSVE
jgi:dihydroxyacetone kinase-like predicted kinase